MSGRTVHSHSDWALYTALSASGAVLSSGLDGALLTRAPGSRRESAIRLSSSPATQCAISDDATVAAVAYRDGRVRIYQDGVETKSVTHSAMPHASGVALSANAHIRAMCYSSGTLHSVVINTQYDSSSCAQFNGVGGALSLTPDGATIAYRAETSHTKCTINMASTDNLALPIFSIQANGDPGIALSHRMLAIADADKSCVYDARTSSCSRAALSLNVRAPGRYGRIAVSRDAHRIVCAQQGGYSVWDARATRVAVLQINEVAFCYGCATSPHGELATTAATDGVVRLWRVVGRVGPFIRRRETAEDIRWWQVPRPLLSR